MHACAFRLFLCSEFFCFVFILFYLWLTTGRHLWSLNLEKFTCFTRSDSYNRSEPKICHFNGHQWKYLIIPPGLSLVPSTRNTWSTNFKTISNGCLPKIHEAEYFDLMRPHASTQFHPPNSHLNTGMTHCVTSFPGQDEFQLIRMRACVSRISRCALKLVTEQR